VLRQNHFGTHMFKTFIQLTCSFYTACTRVSIKVTYTLFIKL